MTCHGISWEERRKSTEKTNIIPQWQKAALKEATGQPSFNKNRTKRHTRRLHLNYDQKRANSSDGMMALRSHCHLGLGAEPSAMSPTLQLSSFIKRLQTPPLTHWQDWGRPADGACPFVRWSLMRMMCVSSQCIVIKVYPCVQNVEPDQDFEDRNPWFCVRHRESVTKCRDSFTAAQQYLRIREDQYLCSFQKLLPRIFILY